MDTLISLALGLGLSAAAGFRVFVPLFVLSLAARVGYVPLSAGFDWIASDAAIVAFGSATILELVAYYIPVLDHLLDIAASPAAIVAGMILSASVMADLPPLIKWTAVAVGGGGIAAVIQGSTVALRAGSTAATGGLANSLVATGEAGGAIALALLAVALPVVAVALALTFAWIVYKVVQRLFRSPTPRSS
jgi:Domain of unknown function (DUF4126)